MNDNQPSPMGIRPDKLEDYRLLLDRQERILCDLDGCLIQDGKAIDGAAALVDRYRQKFRILSNNSTDTPQTLARKLDGYGIEIDPVQIILAGSAAVDLLAKDYPGARILLLASPAIEDYAKKQGLRPIAPADADELPDLVLICRDTAFSYESVQTVIELVSRGIPYYAANPDLTHPGRDGLPVIETGLILQMVQMATALKPKAVIGKPEPDLFLAALENVAPANAVMIGDNLRTDMEGATRLRMPNIRVSPNLTVGCLL
ncbi:HAD-IIA family hydrolase [Aestuariispira insulae]|nr:HAD-IIA family hydrolase [Aestuariispira insulae]